MASTIKLLSKNWGIRDSVKIDTYMANGGYASLRKAVTQLKPDDVVQEVKKSNLKGLGGAGFPAGVKWGFLPKGLDKPRYLIVNADESEPGSFKDRHIIDNDPHMLLEGIGITCFAIGVRKAFIYVRGEFVEQAKILEAAIAEAYDEGFIGRNISGSGFDYDVILHRGAGAYICGEETGLLESLEGKKGWPRLKPPFPAVVGLYNCPTIINNVETLSCVPHIIEHGGEWFARLGTDKNGGTKLFGVSGHVKKPGVYELPMGTTLREIIYEHAGGVRNDKELKAVIPGGSSAPVLRADEIDVKMDFDSLKAIGSMFGTGCIVVMDEDTCMVEALHVLAKFYAHESCGQCTPCREGTGWIEKILTRILNGEGTSRDADSLFSVAGNILGNTICPLGDAAAMPVQSFVTKFKDEIEFHIRERRCDVAERVTATTSEPSAA